MASRRGTIEHGVAVFAFGSTETACLLNGGHKVPVISITGYQSSSTVANHTNAKIYFSIKNVTSESFVIEASAEFMGKVFYIITSEGI